MLNDKLCFTYIRLMLHVYIREWGFVVGVSPAQCQVLIQIYTNVSSVGHHHI